MGARAPTRFVLTRKGLEELAQRTYRLDARLRNILFLIQKGTPTVDGILENSIFPQDEVVEKLRGLVRDQFVALDGSGPGTLSERPATLSERPATLSAPVTVNDAMAIAAAATAHRHHAAETLERVSAMARVTTMARTASARNHPGPTTINPVMRADPVDTVSSEFPQLDAGISVSQARYILSDFCLDQFGTKGQPLIDAIGKAVDVERLQQVLDRITREVRKQRRPQMPELLSRIREINELPATPTSRLRATASD
jgi:hypothetical protein